MLDYDLPFKILYRVVNVQLKARLDTDKVFAQVTLLPLPKQDKNSMEKEREGIGFASLCRCPPK